MSDPLIPQPGSSLTNFRAMFNLVLVAEGFTTGELPSFRAACASFDARIRTTRPFDTYRTNINVLRLESASAVSATALKVECGPRRGPINTRFRAHFCTGKDSAGNGIPRTVDGDGAGVVAAIEASGLLTGMPYFPLVIINNSGHAGAATRAAGPGGGPTREIAWFTIQTGWETVALHELGHSAFGLADEYEYDGTAAVPPGSVASQPNVSTAATTAALALESVSEHQVWASFIKPTTPAPATAKKTAQTPPPDSLASEPLAPGVTVQDIGLFEGADHHQLGIFRPFADCRMRHTAAPYCPVCEHTIRARLGAWELPEEQGSSFVTGPATHVFTLPLPRLAIGTYDMASGAVHLFDGFKAAFMAKSGVPDLVVPGAALPTGATTIIAFDASGGPYAYTYSFITGARQLGRFVQTAAGVTIQPVWDTGPAFGAPWTSVSMPLINGSLHTLGYNRFTGEAALTPLDLTNPDQPDLISWRDPPSAWQPGWPHVEAFNLREKLMLLRVSDFGMRDVQSLLPLGTRPVSWMPGGTTEPDGFTHHVLDQSAGGPRLIRYSGISGRLALDALRPDGSAFDFIGARRFAPGALSFLGQEAPVFATGRVGQTPFAIPIRVLAWHHAPSQTLRVHAMVAVSG